MDQVLNPLVSSLDYQHIDLLPSMLDVLGLEVKTELLGSSVFDRSRPDRQSVFVARPTNRQPGETVTYIQDADNEQWQRQNPNKPLGQGNAP